MMYKKKNNATEIIKAKFDKIKRLGVFPKKWESANSLAYLLAKVNSMLLFADHTLISELMGKRLDKKGEETNRHVLTIDMAKKLMGSEEYKIAKQKIMQDNFGDIIRNNADMALMLIQRKIIDEDNEMAKVALEMDGRWMRGVKITRIDETKKNKQLAAMMKEIFTPAHVKELDGNN